MAKFNHLCSGAVALLGLAASLRADVALTPVADSYVRNSSAGSNFGTATRVVANNANGVRLFFLKYDLSGIAGPITRLELDLTPSAGNAGNVFNVYGLINGESWSETGITWNNAPAVTHSFAAASGTL